MSKTACLVGNTGSTRVDNLNYYAAYNRAAFNDIVEYGLAGLLSFLDEIFPSPIALIIMEYYDKHFDGNPWYNELTEWLK